MKKKEERRRRGGEEEEQYTKRMNINEVVIEAV